MAMIECDIKFNELCAGDLIIRAPDYKRADFKIPYFLLIGKVADTWIVLNYESYNLVTFGSLSMMPERWRVLK